MDAGIPPQAPGGSTAAPVAVLRRAGRLVRSEDWILAGWVALAAPALLHTAGPSSGPFEPGRPVDGLVGIAAIVGAVVCLALRPASDPPPGPGLPRTAAVGPFVGGLLLVAASSATALDLSGPAVLAIAGGIALVAILARLLSSGPPVVVRRALVAPYILVAGGIFWSVIGAATSGGALPTAIRQAAPGQAQAAVPIVGFLLAFSAVYYAMLVYAPRQIAEREGGPVAWLVRYGLFVASVAFGAGWLALLGG